MPDMQFDTNIYFIHIFISFHTFLNLIYFTSIDQMKFKPGPGFTKGLRQKIVLTLREKSELCKSFVIKLRLFFALTKWDFTKGLRQKNCLRFCHNFKTTAGQT